MAFYGNTTIKNWFYKLKTINNDNVPTDLVDDNDFNGFILPTITLKGDNNIIDIDSNTTNKTIAIKHKINFSNNKTQKLYNDDNQFYKIKIDQSGHINGIEEPENTDSKFLTMADYNNVIEETINNYVASLSLISPGIKIYNYNGSPVNEDDGK